MQSRQGDNGEECITRFPPTSLYIPSLSESSSLPHSAPPVPPLPLYPPPPAPPFPHLQNLLPHSAPPHHFPLRPSLRFPPIAAAASKTGGVGGGSKAVISVTRGEEQEVR
ncbi:unnamed protein product [Closterium sp. NIES-54]